MSKVRTLVQACTILIAVLGGLAVAQPISTVERAAFDVRFDVPADWVGELTAGDAESETLTFTAPGDAGLVVVVLGRIATEDQAGLAGVGPEAVWDAWEGFSSGMEGVRADREGVRTVAGIEAGVIDYVGEGLTGSVVGVVGDALGITIVSIAFDGYGTVVRDGLETILTSFGFLSGVGSGTAAAGNPLSPPAGAVAPRNPLSPPPPDQSATASVAAPDYVELFADTDPRSAFGGVLDVGYDGTWAGTLTGTAYRLTNDSAPDAVRYYFRTDLPGVAGPLAQGTVGVTLGVAPAGGGLSAAGLLFDFDPNDGSYLAFALTTTGYLVLQRSDTGLELLVDEDLDSLRSDGRNRLELRAIGTSVEVIVNGALAATLNGSQPFSGGVGIVAVGTGAFEYQDFRYQRP